jgi:hypothetical protein
MHQIALEENFDPATIFSHSENYAGGVLYRSDQFFAVTYPRRSTVASPVRSGCPCPVAFFASV